jgi:hypothetical protein
MIAETIFCKIMGNNKQNIISTKYSLSYLSQIFNLPFTNIVFHNTSTGEIEKIFIPSLGKICVGMMKFQWILKISAPFISSSL